ncbi:MAG: hypothetical protein QOJ13_2389 [Gaiellales bacterium]|jgi:hypothetical protein|nr:hypothetical protein [Gaiellales bacterium]
MTDQPDINTLAYRIVDEATTAGDKKVEGDRPKPCPKKWADHPTWHCILEAGHFGPCQFRA